MKKELERRMRKFKGWLNALKCVFKEDGWKSRWVGGWMDGWMNW
jgi:hypothetical protein